MAKRTADFDSIVQAAKVGFDDGISGRQRLTIRDFNNAGSWNGYANGYGAGEKERQKILTGLLGKSAQPIVLEF